MAFSFAQKYLTAVRDSLEFYRRKERPLQWCSALGLDFEQFFSNSTLTSWLKVCIFRLGTIMSPKNMLKALKAKKAQILQNITLLRKECVATHIPLKMNHICAVLCSTQYFSFA